MLEDLVELKANLWETAEQLKLAEELVSGLNMPLGSGYSLLATPVRIQIPMFLACPVPFY